MMASPSFRPDRAAALEALRRFVPLAGRDYAARRNFDLGPGAHDGVSQLSPYLRHRIVSEEEVLTAVLGRHSPQAAEKFVQEVFWRTYWKGWLEMRPGVWREYQRDLRRRLDEVQTQSGLRRMWEAACLGQTRVDCFDAWTRELVATGYLHNHARMWFASIWIFTLRLPWELGADFFLRHLLDGDPASNTLSWRWVAGLQTPGKHYLARPDNIAKYTEGRFSPAAGDLNTAARPLEGAPPPVRQLAPVGTPFDPDLKTAFLLHDEDLSPGWILQSGINLVGSAVLTPRTTFTPLAPAPNVTAFRLSLLREMAGRWQERLGGLPRQIETISELTTWLKETGAEQLVTPYAPVGPVADFLAEIHDLPVLQQLRPHDARAWPFATAGFFKFRKQIPQLLLEIRGLTGTRP